MLRTIIAFLLVTSFSYGQFTVNGEIQPTGNYPYMIMYQLQGAKQNYIAHDSIRNGKFSIMIPAKQTSGVYRLIYDMKNRLFVDFIYDNENVSLTLNPKNPNQSVLFTNSENNKIYQNYLKETQPLQQKLDALQTLFFSSSDKSENKKNSTLYKKTYNNLITIQQQFETQSTGKLVNHFIKASTRYNSKDLIKSTTDYLASVKDHFFDNIDFNNKALLNSTFINDKINDFIFHLNTSDDKNILNQLYKESIAIVINKIRTNVSLTKDIEEGLLYTFAEQENISMVNTVLNYYLQLPNELQDRGFIGDIKGQLKTAIGNIAPNILWTEENKSQSLHMLSNSSYYVVAFWSSTCSHCLKELPLLKEYLKDKKEVEILSIGLETEESKNSWKDETYYYPDWIHIYGKDKWKNKFAREYGVNATPSFFILDAKKKILAKPDDVAELKAFFIK